MATLAFDSKQQRAAADVLASTHVDSPVHASTVNEKGVAGGAEGGEGGWGGGEGEGEGGGGDGEGGGGGLGDRSSSPRRRPSLP